MIHLLVHSGLLDFWGVLITKQVQILPVMQKLDMMKVIVAILVVVVNTLCLAWSHL